MFFLVNSSLNWPVLEFYFIFILFLLFYVLWEVLCCLYHVCEHMDHPSHIPVVDSHIYWLQVLQCAKNSRGK